MKKIFTFFILLIIFSCASYQPTRYNLSEFKKSYKSYDLNIFWNEERKGEILTVDGVVKNVYLGKISELEITVRVVENDKKISEAIYRFFPEVLKPDDLLPFRLTISLPEGKDYNISYFYRGYLITDEMELTFGSF